jgi:hypothetical protein
MPALTIIPIGNGRYSVALHITPELLIESECDAEGLLALVRRLILEEK